MNFKAMNVFSKTRGWLLAVSCVGIMVVGKFYGHNSSILQELMQFSNALEICSARVGQSYTASMLADNNSIYMDSNFTGATEECFADIVGLTEESKTLGQSGLKKINALASSTHWFHESLRSSGSAFSAKEQDVTGKVQSKYGDFETSRDSFGEVIALRSDKVNERISDLSLSLIFLMSVIFIAGFIEVMTRRAYGRARKEIEEEALSELLSDDHTTANKVEGIISGALKLNQMAHCEKLLSTYRQNVFVSKEEGKEHKTPVGVAMGSQEEIDQVANQVWNESESSSFAEDIEKLKAVSRYSPDEEVLQSEIEATMSKIIEHTSTRIASEGIVLETQFDNANIFAEEESLEQALYYIINTGIINAASSIDKKLTLKGKSLGSVYNFEVLSSGTINSAEDSSLMIAKEIAKDSNGRVEVSNIYENKEIVGLKARLILKTSSRLKVVTTQPKEVQREATVRRLERGTKKEIMQRLSIQ